MRSIFFFAVAINCCLSDDGGKEALGGGRSDGMDYEQIHLYIISLGPHRVFLGFQY